MDDYAEAHGRACSAAEALWLGTEEDSYPPAELVLGDPPAARIITCDSHEAIWIGYAESATSLATYLLEQIGHGWPLEAIDLDLGHLIPEG